MRVFFGVASSIGLIIGLVVMFIGEMSDNQGEFIGGIIVAAVSLVILLAVLGFIEPIIDIIGDGIAGLFTIVFKIFD